MMRTDYTDLSIYAEKNEPCMAAAAILADEILARTGKKPTITETPEDAAIGFYTDATMQCKDDYRIGRINNGLSFTANGIRGLIYAIGMFLRKTLYSSDQITLIEDISASYSPFMRIRGHQVGYRASPNTYDAWSVSDYVRYYKDMMYFGINTVEHIPAGENDTYNRLMQYTTERLCTLASEEADKLDLDVSLWYPNSEATLEKALENREKAFSVTPRIDAVFPPGGDPGDLPAEEFIDRANAISRVLKKIHPHAQMWPSAQAPHSIADWGEGFIKAMEQFPDGIDGIILGPNRAMDLDELRDRLPEKYPIRLYPDITHNVRCEYPVHFDRDDWHYAWAATESRECINPRPQEYRAIHRSTRPYIIGSVSYSEGVNDDLNKMIWSDMDYFGETDLRTSVKDYVRLFFPGSDIDLLTDAIFGLEENWKCDPAENACIEATYEKWIKAGESNPALYHNWRYVMHLFRAACDMIVKKRKIFESELIRSSRIYLHHHNLHDAQAVLQTDYPDDYKALREKIEEYAAFLFEAIGLQLDVERYSATSWERGATLETIDNSITNRAYYLSRFALAEQMPEEQRLDFMRSVYDRETAAPDEYYYSVALHGLEGTGMRQDGYVYLNFRGDDPKFSAQSSPVGVMNVYDNYTFRCKVGRLNALCDYELRVVYLSRKEPQAKHHKITFNGHVIYDGEQFGNADPEYDRKYLPSGFESAVYTIPHAYIKNGCGVLEMSENTMGVMFSEFSIKKRRTTE